MELSVVNRKINNHRLLFCIVFLFTCISSSIAQHKPFKIYTVDDGIISNTIIRIFQDADGFMWFGSNEGLSIYDGYKFSSYSIENKNLSDNSVNSFFEKSKDEIWVIHDSGVDIFLKRKFIKAIRFKELNTIIKTRDGKLIAAGNKGIYELKDNKQVKVFSSDKNLFNLYEVGDYFIADETRWNSIFLIDKSFHLVSITNAGGIIEKDKTGTIWIHGGKQLYLVDTNALKSGQLNLLAPPQYFKPFVKQGLTYISKDSEGSCWFSVAEKGIFRVDRTGSIKRFNASNGLNSNHTGFFFEDAEGNIWATGVGIVKFSHKEFEIFSKADGLSSDYISSLDVSPHAFWLAQVNGISCLYNHKIYNFPYADNDKNTWTSILLNGDSLWVGNTHLWLYKIKYFPTVQLTLIRDWPEGVNRLQNFTDGSLLFSNQLGLFRITKKLKLQRVYEAPNFFKFLATGNEIIGGGQNTGLSIWNISSINDQLLLKLKAQFDPSICNQVFDIAKDRSGSIWVGSYSNGIINFQNCGNGNFTIRNFKSKSGLNALSVSRMLISADGRLYVGTTHGLYDLDLPNNSTQFEDLNRKYGFISEVYDVKETSTGDLLLGTSNGAVLIRKNMTSNSLPPRVFFTQIFHNNKPAGDLQSNISMHRFPYDENNFSFDFVATSFRNEDQVLYSYALKKDDRSISWSEPGKIHSLNFPDLSPGNYSLEIKALSSDNLWSEAPARYDFIIATPFWNKWWFATLIFLFIGTAGAGIFRFRLRQIKQVLNLRTKISRDLHDEIGSTLSGIGLFSALAKRQLENAKEAEVKNSLDRIITNCDDILGKMSDIVWAINPQNDSFEKMVLRLKTFAVFTSGSKNIHLHFNADKEIHSYNLDMQRRKNVYLICKEAINNAIKYSDCENLYFNLETEHNRIQIRIQDDGKGFNVVETVGGNGLNNIKARAKEINADINLNSEKNKGTSINLILKFT